MFTHKGTIAALLAVSFIPNNGIAEKPDYIKTFDLKPVILDSDESESSTLGLQYTLQGTLLSKDVSDDDKGSLAIDSDPTIKRYDVSYVLKGLIAESSDKNAKDFLESRIAAQYFRSADFTFKAGGFIKYEADQNFDDRQFVYGLTGTAGKMGALADNDSLSLHLNVGQVDPSEDTAREAVLGSDLDSYERVDFELLYIYPIGTENLETFEINYRYFMEIAAEEAIRDADLDRFRLATYRLGLKNKFFVAYSSGELPFNQQDNQIYEVGFSHKFF